MTDKERAEEELLNMWEKMAEEAKAEVLPSELTIEQFMDKINENGHHVTKWQARYYLEKQISEGKMTKRLVRNTNYYRPVL